MLISGIPYIKGRNAYNDPDGKKYAIAIHNTSNNASAKAEASYATRRTDGVSSHLYGDRIDVIQSLDTVYKAGHAGSANGNNNAVAVELTGTNDKSRQWWIENVNWTLLGRSLAQVCRAYDIAVRRASVAEMRSNPKVRAFYSHNDMRLAWGGTTHNDPGGNFPWDYLFSAVNLAMAKPTPPAVQPRKDDDMGFLAKDTSPDSETNGTVFHVVGGFSHPVTQRALDDMAYMTPEGAYTFDQPPKTHTDEWERYTAPSGVVVYIRKGWNAESFAPVYER